MTSSRSSPPPPGSLIKFTAKVCGVHTLLPAAVPTGSVTFTDQGAVLATIALAPGGGTGCATAVLPTSSLAPGRHKIVGAYSGDPVNSKSRGSVVQSVHS